MSVRWQLNQNWNFKECVNNIKALKQQYASVLMSFSYFESRERGGIILDLRNNIYSLNIIYWQRNLLWDYLNDNLTFEQLERLVGKNGNSNKATS